MYSWTESPQMREKLTSIIENRFCAAAAPADRIVRLPSALIWMTLLESHHSDWMAARIIASYFDLRPVPGAALREPSALGLEQVGPDDSALGAISAGPGRWRVEGAQGTIVAAGGVPPAREGGEELLAADPA